MFMSIAITRLGTARHGMAVWEVNVCFSPSQAISWTTSGKITAAEGSIRCRRIPRSSQVSSRFTPSPNQWDYSHTFEALGIGTSSGLLWNSYIVLAVVPSSVNLFLYEKSRYPQFHHLHHSLTATTTIHGPEAISTRWLFFFFLPSWRFKVELMIHVFERLSSSHGWCLILFHLDASLEMCGFVG